MCILTIGHIKCSRTALHFTGEEWKVHIPCTHKEGDFSEVANKWLKFLKLGLGECFSSKPHRIIGLRVRLGQWNRSVPAFVHAFNTRHCLFPRIARFSADETIKREISLMTLASLRFLRASQLFSKRWLENIVSSGIVCCISSSCWHIRLLSFVILAHICQ